MKECLKETEWRRWLVQGLEAVQFGRSQAVALKDVALVFLMGWGYGVGSSRGLGGRG